MIESIDTSLIDWSRAQFAMTAMYTGFCSSHTRTGSGDGNHGDAVL